MLPEISLNILDIAQNSISADASLIQIYVETDSDPDLLTVTITDNGKGMTEEEVQRKNEQLKSGKRETGSIGIQNVHTRMRAAYGDAYGVSLKRNEPGGICVMLRFPGEENKNV